MAGRAVTVVRAPGTPTAVVRAATTWDDFPRLWPQLLEEVWAVLRATDGITPGHNVMLYRDGVPNVEVGAEVEGPFPGDGRVVASALPAGEAATTVALGAPTPEGIGAAHAAVGEWCAANGRTPAGPRWEVYGHWRDDQDPDAFEIAVHWLLEPA